MNKIGQSRKIWTYSNKISQNRTNLDIIDKFGHTQTIRNKTGQKSDKFGKYKSYKADKEEIRQTGQIWTCLDKFGHVQIKIRFDNS